MATKSLVALSYGSSRENPATTIPAARSSMALQRGLEALPYRVPVYPEDSGKKQESAEENLR